MFRRRACQQLAPLLWDHVRQRLTQAEQERMEEHLAHCPSCRVRAESCRQTVRLLEAYRSQPLPAVEDGWPELLGRLKAERSTPARRPILIPSLSLGGAAMAVLLLTLTLSGRQPAGDEAPLESPLPIAEVALVTDAQPAALAAPEIAGGAPLAAGARPAPSRPTKPAARPTRPSRPAEPPRVRPTAPRPPFRTAVRPTGPERSASAAPAADPADPFPIDGERPTGPALIPRGLVIGAAVPPRDPSADRHYVMGDIPFASPGGPALVSQDQSSEREIW